jgi:putative PIN family toxin of toxin-antitoxin system
MRIVVDTSVLVRYLLRPSTAARSLIEDLWLQDSVTLIVSPELLAELAEVLQRPKIRRFVTAEDAAALLDAVQARAEFLPPLADIPPFTRDPKDDKFVACGLSGSAQYLVTYDDDLLVLGSIEGMQIATPETFVRCRQPQQSEQDR